MRREQSLAHRALHRIAARLRFGITPKVDGGAATEELVMDDGTLLTPLNRTVPARDVWQPLACPFCGGRLLKEGQIHTLQQGWV